MKNTIIKILLIFLLGTVLVCSPTSNNDSDDDGILNVNDNCPNNYNPDQADEDTDGIGNVCDLVNNNDLDGDGILNDNDNCPNHYNPSQLDDDNDGVGNVCNPNNENNDIIITNDDVISFYYVNEGFYIRVLTNDIIPNKDQVEIIIVQPPKYGTFKVIEADPLSIYNDYIYYKTTNFHDAFSDSFTYMLKHTDGYNSNVSKVSIVWRANP
ncbi:thrombospondin type 3 repeat-containing protein [Thalassobellus citreus]|uniref:thrombospondin type 3 repeat-containing protein n=1 Tax=Thalassobellus citreus TaxID=3367752 RepID=UPI00379A4E2C